MKIMECIGCPVQGVMLRLCDYVEEVIASLKSDENNLIIGVVGYGNVGKLVAAMAERKGYKV